MTRFQTGEPRHLVRASTVVNCIKKKEVNIQLSKKKKKIKKGLVAFIFFYHFQAIPSDVICPVCNREYASDQF